ncbi:MAG TPA: AMIN domain-containing protein, partial [Desulfobacterales bacterium]|nr:AMIN domain-containing protein [Desulfobacterales bacterium]
MYMKLSTYYLAVFCSLFLMLTCNVQATEKQENKGTYSIQSIATDLQGNSLVMLVKGDSAPAYTMYELFSPARLVLDIAEADLAQSIDVEKILPQNSFATLKITTLNDKKPKITRFEITLAETHTYKVNRLENNLSVRLFPREQTTAASPVASGTMLALHDLVVRSQNNKTEILLQADTPIKDFRQETATGRDGLPDSMFIDINNIDGSELMREKTVGTNLDKIRVATRGTGVRIVFDSGQDTLFSYDIQTVPQGLLVTIDENPGKSPAKQKTA